MVNKIKRSRLRNNVFRRLVMMVSFEFGLPKINPQSQLNLEENSSLVRLILSPINRMMIWTGERRDKTSWLARIGIFCFAVNFILQVTGTYPAKDDPDKLFECFSTLTFQIVACLKLISLLLNRETWQFLLAQIHLIETKQLEIEADPQEHESDDDCPDRFTKHIELYTNRLKTISSLIIKMYGATITVFTLSPFIEYVFWTSQGIEQEYPHLLPMWTVIDDSLVTYVICILFEILGSSYCVFVHTTFDLASIGVMIFICGQFSLLKSYSEHIAGSEKGLEMSAEIDFRAHLRIKRSQQINILLVKSIRELNKLLKNILGLYFLVSTATLCFIAVRLITDELSAMELVSLVQYMCGILTQLFLYCYYGDAVYHESSIKMGEGPFGASYWRLSGRVRRELVTLGVSMARQNLMQAGPFNSLSLPSFVQIIRAAYSYYALIRK